MTLLIAQNYKFDLGPDMSVVVTLVLNPEYGQFIPAIVPENVQVRDMVKEIYKGNSNANQQTIELCYRTPPVF